MKTYTHDPDVCGFAEADRAYRGLCEACDEIARRQDIADFHKHEQVAKEKAEKDKRVVRWDRRIG